MTSPNKTWQEDLNELSHKVHLININGDASDYLKSFISQTLTSQAQRLREAMNKISKRSGFCECKKGNETKCNRCLENDWGNCRQAMLTAFDKALED